MPSYIICPYPYHPPPLPYPIFGPKGRFWSYWKHLRLGQFHPLWFSPQISSHQGKVSNSLRPLHIPWAVLTPARLPVALVALIAWPWQSWRWCQRPEKAGSRSLSNLETAIQMTYHDCPKWIIIFELWYEQWYLKVMVFISVFDFSVHSNEKWHTYVWILLMFSWANLSEGTTNRSSAFHVAEAPWLLPYERGPSPGKNGGTSSCSKWDIFSPYITYIPLWLHDYPHLVDFLAWSR